MASGLSPKLPLTKDPRDGYALNKTYVDLTKQNLKMLVLTSPGERIMYPDFGVGIRNFLFENIGEMTYSRIRERLSEQVQLYMPFVSIQQVDISEVKEGPAERNMSNSISIYIKFFIIPLELTTSLEIKAAIN